MKTYLQFFEDIDQRREELRQRQLDQMAANKEKIAAYREQQQERIAAQREAQEAQKRKRIQQQEREQERQRIKNELRQELQSQQEELQLEQSPTMKPNIYNQMVAKRQASQKSSHIKHVHQEIGSEARSQEAAKRERLKTIMSR